MGVLIEHSGGASPVWLASVQVAIVPKAGRHLAYAQGAAEELNSRSFSKR